MKLILRRDPLWPRPSFKHTYGVWDLYFFMPGKKVPDPHYGTVHDIWALLVEQVLGVKKK